MEATKRQKEKKRIGKKKAKKKKDFMVPVQLPLCKGESFNVFSPS